MVRRSHVVLLLLSSLMPLPGGGTQLPGKGEQSTGAIQGTVHGRQLSEPVPLANAIVSVTAGYRQYTVTADADGHYSVPGLVPGAWRVQAIHVGYRPMSATVRVPPDGTVTLDMSLTWEPVRLPTLVIRAGPVRPLISGSSAPPSELGEVALRALEGTPGMVEGGLAEVVRSIPGNDPSDPRDVLLMRGSATDLKLVLLDGAPVYTPFHMAGLVESFDPEALGGASLFLGGAPARFDGGLSYILELKGRNPRRDRVRGSAAVDLLTSRLFLEGPFGSSTGFLVAGRAIHDLGTPLLGKGPSPYGFGDLITRFVWEGGSGRNAYLTGFWNQESVLLDLPEAAAEALDQAPTLGGSGGVFGRTSPSDAARWGNRALAAGYGAELGRTRAELRVAFSRYEAELPVGDTLPLFAQSRSDRARLSAEFSHPLGEGVLRFGGSCDRVNSDYSAIALDSARAGEVNRAGLDGSSAGVYLEASRPLTESLSIRGGGRLDRFQGDLRVRFAPRLSLTWLLTEQVALTLAAGRYHQYSNVASRDLATNIGPVSSGAGVGGAVPLELRVGSADHLVVSLDQILTPGVSLGLEGFVKTFSGVSGTRNRSMNASGVDLRVAREGERTSGWLGYTLTWFWASDGLLTSGASPFSGRHLLSAGLTTSVTSRTGLRLRASYGDGLPYTSVPVGRDGAPSPSYDETVLFNSASDQVLNSAPELTVGPDEGFLRLEVELFGHWSPAVAGRTMQLQPYLRVINALNRRDALFYHFDPWRAGGPEPLADLPLLPLFGLEWRF